MSECVVYWKHLKDMSSDYTDGYIGISKNFEERQKQHHRDAFVRNSIYTVHERMRMYGEEVQTTIIFEGSINNCFDYEEKLRPRWHMGWNMAIGGGRPGSGWKPNPLWLDNRLWHANYGEYVISKTTTATDLARKYYQNKDPSSVQGNISRVLHGKIAHAYGWELANAQLAMRVKDRIHEKWNHVYLTNHETTISVHKSGNSKFITNYNYNPNSMKISTLANGSQRARKGWELATEEEWLATKERKEFK